MAAGGQVGGGGEVGAVAGLGGGAGQADGQVCLSYPGGSNEQDVGGGLEVAAGGELVDQLRVDAGGGVGSAITGAEGAAAQVTATETVAVEPPLRV